MRQRPYGCLTIGIHSDNCSHGTATSVRFSMIAGSFFQRRDSGFGKRPHFPEGIRSMAAIVVGTLAYCWGSVLSRPMVQAHGVLLISGLATLTGGIMLIALALIIEPVSWDLLAVYARPEVLGAWLFLVVFGSLAAFTIYLRLLRDWGPLSAGMYAFISPVIAVGLGSLVFAEAFGPVAAFGSLLMLGAAWLALASNAATKVATSNASSANAEPHRPAPPPGRPTTVSYGRPGGGAGR